MKRLSCSIFALLALALTAIAASFPYITLNKHTNQLSDNGTALTFNGAALGGSTNLTDSGTNVLAQGAIDAKALSVDGFPVSTNWYSHTTTDQEGGTAYGFSLTNAFSGQLATFAIKYETNNWGVPSTAFVAGNTESNFNLMDVFRANSFIYGIGAAVFDQSTWGGNNDDVYMFGDTPFVQAGITNCNEIYGLGYQPFKSSSLNNSFHIYGIGDSFVSAVITNSNHLMAYGYGTGLGSTFTNCTQLQLFGGMQSATLSDSQDVVTIGQTAGNGISGSYTNIVLIGDGATIGATGQNEVILGPNMTLTLEGHVYADNGSSLTRDGSAVGGAPLNSPAFTGTPTINGQSIETQLTNKVSNWTADGTINSTLVGNATADGVRGTNGVFVGYTGTRGLTYSAGLINAPVVSFDGTPYIAFDWNTLQLRSDGALAWGPTTTPVYTAGDLYLQRDAANTLAQRNGANAQSSRIYTSYTDASNYERLGINTAAGSITLAAESAGTGSGNIDLKLSPKGTGKVDASSTTIQAGKVVSSTQVEAGPSTYYGFHLPNSARFSCPDGVGIIRFANYNYDGFTGFRLGPDQAAPSAVYIRPGDGSGTDKTGGSLTIAGGQSTGTGRGGAVVIQTSTTAPTGSTANALNDRARYVPKFVDLTDNTATTLFTVALPATNTIGISFTCTIQASDGTDFQSLTTPVTIDAVAKTTTITAVVAPTAAQSAVAASGGTLSVTYTVVDAGSNVLAVKVTADTSFGSPTYLRAKIVMTGINGMGAGWSISEI